MILRTRTPAAHGKWRHHYYFELCGFQVSIVFFR